MANRSANILLAIISPTNGTSSSWLATMPGGKPLLALDKRLEAPLIEGIGGAKVSARVPQLGRQKVGGGRGKGGTLAGQRSG
jgi:hypothetical protein